MILLVEEHADTAAVMVRLLKLRGFDAVAVATGAAALNWLQTTRPLVIVLDLTLPDMTGFDVIAIIRRRPGLADVPIVVFTGDASETATRWACLLGANEVVVKGSVDLSALCTVIARYAPEPVVIGPTDADPPPSPSSTPAAAINIEPRIPSPPTRAATPARAPPPPGPARR